MVEARSGEGKQAAWLLAILAVGAVLRIVGIGREALWSDEALTYVLAKVPAWALATQPIDPTPPLYYWLHALLIPDGASAVHGRMISLVAGVATIPLVYLAGRRIDGPRVGQLAAALVAVSAPLIDYAQEARAYALLVMLVMASAVALLRIVQAEKGPRSIDLAAFALLCLLAIYTHFVALFWVASALVVLGRASGLAPRQLYGTVLAIGVGALPELIRAYRYATETNAFHWLKQAGLTEAAAMIAGQWGVFAVLLALVMVAAGWGGLRRWVKEHRSEAGVIAALLVQPLLLWLFGYIVSPVFMGRTILVAVPGFGLLAAVAVRSYEGWRWAALAAAMVAATVLSAAVGKAVPKENWWAATEFVTARPVSTVLACPQWKAQAMMAALGPRQPAAMLAVDGGRIVRIDRQDQRSKTWDRAYFEHFFRPRLDPRLGKARLRSRSETIELTEVAVVASECSPAERQVIVSWLGDGALQERWASTNVDPRLNIAIEIVRIDGAREVRLYY